jgi:hypothetical protein
MKYFILCIIILSTNNLSAQNKLLIYDPQNKINLICEYKICCDSIIKLFSFHFVHTQELQDKIPLLKDINEQTYFSVKMKKIKRDKTLFKVNAVGFKLFKSDFFAYKMDISNLLLKQIIEIEIGTRFLTCGNLNTRVKKIISDFSNIKLIEMTLIREI